MARLPAASSKVPPEGAATAVLAVFQDLVQFFLPRLVRLAATGASREEKYTPSSSRLLGVKPRHWGFVLVLGGLLVALLQALLPGEPRPDWEGGTPQAGRLRFAALASMGAALFSDPRDVTLVYFLRLFMAYLDHACRKGLVLPAASHVSRELFVTMVGLAELWWQHLRFARKTLPAFTRRLEEAAGAGGTGPQDGNSRSLRRYTVLFRVAERTTCSEVERLLQQAQGHFPLPRRWDKRRIHNMNCVFLEYEDVGTRHHGKEMLVCKVRRHPSRGRLYAGVGLATIRELEELYHVDIPTERIKLEPDHVVFTIFGYSNDACVTAAQQIQCIAELDSSAENQIRKGNAFSRGKKAEEVLRKGGLHVVVRPGGNHGGIADCAKAVEEALAQEQDWAVSILPPLGCETTKSQFWLRQKDGFDSVSIYKTPGGQILLMLLNGTKVEVRSRQNLDGICWLEVVWDGKEEQNVGFVKQHNVAGMDE